MKWNKKIKRKTCGEVNNNKERNKQTNKELVIHEMKIEKKE